MKSLLQSRKFWITVTDAIVSIVTMAVTLYLANDIQTRGFVLGLLAALQPVIISLINGIAHEDAANVTAGAAVEAAQVVAKSDAEIASLPFPLK